MPTPYPSRPVDPAPHYLTFAGVLLDLHRTIALPDEPVTDRAELDALHAHLVAIHRIVDAHSSRARASTAPEGDHLRTARAHLWQATEQMHLAFHHAPRAERETPRTPEHDACHRRLPEGAPALSICRRHITALARVRAHSTPADLRMPLPGQVQVRHAKKKEQ